MKEISSLQAEYIKAATGENFTAYPPAALEKDIHLTEIIAEINKVNVPNVVIIFGGGTSLVKGYKLFDRMSEDLDFKVQLPSQNSKNANKNELKILKNELLSLVTGLGFQVTEKRARDGHNYFSFELTYQSYFPAEVSLRNYIKLEFTNSPIRETPSILKIDTLLSNATKKKDAETEFPCVSLSQTAAEKILSLLTRFNPNIESRDENYDLRIVRHLHDIFFLLKDPTVEEKTPKIFRQVLAEDFERFSHLSEGLLPDLKTRLIEKMDALNQSKTIGDEYDRFVLNLTLGNSPSIAEAKSVFMKIAPRCIEACETPS